MINVENCSYPLLDDIKTPSDIRTFDAEQLIELAGEIRRCMLSIVSRSGGHLASSLGAVELVIALH